MMELRLLPVRCFSCNQPLQEAWAGFKRGMRQGRPAHVVLADLRVDRFCCRRMLLTQPIALTSLSVEQTDAAEAMRVQVASEGAHGDAAAPSGGAAAAAQRGLEVAAAPQQRASKRKKVAA